MEEIKNKVEALLFSSARSMSVEEISELIKIAPQEIRNALEELKKKYDSSSTIDLIQEGSHWKLTIKDAYLPLVKKIVTHTELSKTLMETLAVVAFKYPIKQSDLIKIRTNKAYDHLKELEERGYITRQKYGRTRLIKLSQKFFDYFDLPRDKLKEKFKDFGSLAKAIEDKEELIEKMKQRKSKIFVAKETPGVSVDLKPSFKHLKNNSFSNKEKLKKGKEEKITIVKESEVDLVDEKGEKVKLEVVDEPEVYEEEKPAAVEVFEEKEKLGNLEVIDEPESKEEPEEEQEEEEKKKIEEPIEKQPSEEEIPEDLEESPDIMEELKEKKVETEIEKEIDRRVDALLHKPKEEREEGEEETEETGEDTDSEDSESDEEPEDLLEASQKERKKE